MNIQSDRVMACSDIALTLSECQYGAAQAGKFPPSPSGGPRHAAGAELKPRLSPVHGTAWTSQPIRKVSLS